MRIQFGIILLVISSNFLFAQGINCDTLPPPSNIQVDPISLLVTWDSPPDTLFLNIIDYQVYLDSVFQGTTDTTVFQLSYCDYDRQAQVCVVCNYQQGLSSKACKEFHSSFLQKPGKMRAIRDFKDVQLKLGIPLVPDTSNRVCCNKEVNPLSLQFITRLTGGTSLQSITTDGQHFYVSSTSNMIFKFDINGQLIESFNIPGLGSVTGMAFEPNEGYFYCAVGTNKVFIANFYSAQMVAVITAPSVISSIAYDYSENGFWGTSNTNDYFLFSHEGDLIKSFPRTKFFFTKGLSFDGYSPFGPFLWMICRQNEVTTLVKLQINSGHPLFFTEISSLTGFSGDPAGLFAGCGLYEENIITLGGLLGQDSVYGLELWTCDSILNRHFVPPANLLGCNLLRNNEQLRYLPYYGGDTISAADTIDFFASQDYRATALYDMSVYGMPGSIGESNTNDSIIVNGPNGYPLPFIENWDSSNFVDQRWLAEDGWIIDTVSGKPAPSAVFSPPGTLINYNSKLQTHINIDASQNFSGVFTLYFDLFPKFQNVDSSELLIIKLIIDSTEIPLCTFANDTTYDDWKNYCFDISNMVRKSSFAVRFEAQGEDSDKLLAWNIDNIRVIRDCPPPENLDISITLMGVELQWSPPALPHNYPEGQWIYWDSGQNESGVGLSAGGTFSVAIRWDVSQLQSYDSLLVYSVRFYPYEDITTAAFELKVWEGHNSPSLIYTQEITDLNPGTWNEVVLDDLLQVDITEDLWVGFTITHDNGEKPMGQDEGPGITGYGDMISLDQKIWESITNYGYQFDKNWNIKVFVFNYSTGSVFYDLYGNDPVLGYEIYNWGSPLEQTHDTNFLHIPNNNSWQCYQIKACYLDCESDFIYSDTIHFWIPNIKELSSKDINIYPNPCNDILFIDTPKNVKEIIIYNLFGQEMLHQQTDSDKILLKTDKIPNGSYIIKIKSQENKIHFGKFVVAH